MAMSCLFLKGLKEGLATAGMNCQEISSKLEGGSL